MALTREQSLKIAFQMQPANIRLTLLECLEEERHRIGDTYTLAQFLANIVGDEESIAWRSLFENTAHAYRENMAQNKETCTACPTHCGTEPEYVTENIRRVTCVLCGHATTDRDAIESWNQYGEHYGLCVTERHDLTVTVWDYSDGTHATIATTKEGDYYRHEVTQ